MTTQGEREGESGRSDIFDRLKNVDVLQSQGALAELAYRRAREALEKALEEAGKIRLQALEDARSTREREVAMLMESLKALRQSAEVQVQAILAQADLEASQVRERARLDAEAQLETARREAQDVTAQAAAVRQGAEARAREVEKLEAGFNEMAGRMADRLGLAEKPAEGWWARLFRGPPDRR